MLVLILVCCCCCCWCVVVVLGALAGPRLLGDLSVQRALDLGGVGGADCLAVNPGHVPVLCGDLPAGAARDNAIPLDRPNAAHAADQSVPRGRGTMTSTLFLPPGSPGSPAHAAITMPHRQRSWVARYCGLARASSGAVIKLM